MKRITHTKDSLRLIEFLKRYPNQWHSIKGDRLTRKALERCIDLYPGRIAVTDYHGYNQQTTQQIKFNEEVA